MVPINKIKLLFMPYFSTSAFAFFLSIVLNLFLSMPLYITVILFSLIFKNFIMSSLEFFDTVTICVATCADIGSAIHFL